MTYPANFEDGNNDVRLAGNIVYTDAANQPQAPNSPVQVSGAATIRSGTGSPNAAVAGAVGDLFIRTDGDPTASTYLYACTVADASAATYVALVTA